MTMVYEPEVTIFDEELFGDDSEHYYSMECYDGYAIGKTTDDDGMPPVIKMTYPKRDEVLADEKLSKYVLQYRGLCDLAPEDIHYGDIMMALGEIEH